MNEFTVSNELIIQPEALRARAQQDGYLFFRDLIDRDALFALRKQIFDLCADAGWLAPGTDPMDGIAAPGVAHVEPEPDFLKVYGQLMKMENFHTFAHQPALIAMLDTLFGEPTLVHARNIARIIFPQATKFTTPAHQDYIFIQGTPETWTAWIPLGDCPKELGSLAVLSGSHRDGFFPLHTALGAGGLSIDTDRLPYEWAASDFSAGDVLLFQSMLVHKGLPNVTSNRIRVSMDFRYQGESQPLVESSLMPHLGILPWDEIYGEWQSREYQYYWKDKPLQLVDWNPKLIEVAQTK